MVVDAKRKQIMEDGFDKMASATGHYNADKNYVIVANIAGFEKVVEAMVTQDV